LIKFFQQFFTDSSQSSKGNVLIMGVMVISILSMFGVSMTYRMIVDADISARLVSGNKALYLADSGIQWGRKYLLNNSAATTLGPLSIGDGEVTVVITRTTALYPDENTSINIYRTTSTAVVEPTTRIIEELRYRGGGVDKDFLLWREDIDTNI
jgi:Tfp pilus assembly protein PilX